MILPPRTILGLAIVGDDLHAARVRVGPRTARVTGRAVVESFLDQNREDSRRALGSVVGLARSAVLVIPGAWCAVRPFELTCRAWPAAKEEVRRSIDRLAPIEPAQALVGLVDVVEAVGAATAGSLCAVQRDLVEPWSEAIAAALGREVSATLTPLMAALGLGFQRAERTVIYEPAALGEWLRHELAFGLPTVAADPVDTVDRGRDPDAQTLPGGDAEPTLSGVELAAGAAAASVIAPGAFAPLAGRAPMRRAVWAAPALGIIAAAGLLIAAPVVTRARDERALADLGREERAMQAAFERAEEARTDTEQLTRLLDGVVAPATAGWSSVLPILSEAAAALPREGYLSRLDLDERGVTIAGEAPETPAILQRLEDSPVLQNARRIGRLAPGGAPGLDLFEMRADRAGAEVAP